MCEEKNVPFGQSCSIPCVFKDKETPQNLDINRYEYKQYIYI